jgi:hypothetical protein
MGGLGCTLVAFCFEILDSSSLVLVLCKVFDYCFVGLTSFQSDLLHHDRLAVLMVDNRFPYSIVSSALKI